jgi:hypothetical protein
MVEAHRLARQAGMPIFFIDLALADPIRRGGGGLYPDPAFAPRLGKLFMETFDAILAAEKVPAPGDLAREAHMASRLCELMERFDRVLWVGGMAHWARIRGRLEKRDFDGPTLRLARRPKAFARMRMDSTVLQYFAGRFPYQIAQFARQPTRYTDAQCLGQLALAAVKPEKFQPVEVAAMLLYSRNLAAMGSLDETPGLWELLTSSSSVLGNKYAGRLASLALFDRFTEATERYPLLTRAGRVGVFRADGKVMRGRSLWGGNDWVISRAWPSQIDINRRIEDEPATEVKKAKPDEKLGWAAYPDDGKGYEYFVRFVLEQVSKTSPDETAAVPLISGMAEGIDIRATVRHWRMGEIYVREPVRSPIRVTNGLIDWTSRSERSWILQNTEAPKDERDFDRPTSRGWIDPSHLVVGSASRTVRSHTVLQNEPFLIQRNFREVSLLTLDAPIWVKDETSTRKSFYEAVIMELLPLKGGPYDNIYGWLEVMFRFCKNKPFVYYSHYIPSPRILNIARKFGVRVIHLPLTRIPERMRQQHQSFRFMNLTRRQWEELLERVGELRRAWTAPAPGARKAPETGH